MTSTIQWTAETFADPKAPIRETVAARSVASAFQSADKATLGAVHKAALLTFRVFFVTETVGKGTAQTSQGDYAKSIGRTSGMVTGYRRLGRALIVHGVEHGSPLWAMLCKDNKAGGALGAVLEGEAGTVDLTALAESLAPKAKAKGPDAKGTDATGDGEAKAKPSTPSQVWGEAMAVAFDAVPGLTSAQLRTAANTVTNLLATVQAAQKASAAKADKSLAATG